MWITMEAVMYINNDNKKFKQPLRRIQKSCLWVYTTHRTKKAIQFFLPETDCVNTCWHFHSLFNYFLHHHHSNDVAFKLEMIVWNTFLKVGCVDDNSVDCGDNFFCHVVCIVRVTDDPPEWQRSSILAFTHTRLLNEITQA